MVAAMCWVPTGANAGTDVAESEIDRAITFRERLGLRAGDEFVAATFGDVDRFGNQDWGVPLTDAEAADLNHRVEIIGLFTQAVAYAMGQDDYAGMFYDQLDGGKPNFLFTGHSDRHVGDIRALANESDDFVVHVARHSMRELERVSDAILGDATMVTFCVRRWSVGSGMIVCGRRSASSSRVVPSGR